MVYGICPNCVNELNEFSALVTQDSKVFKGGNHYVMCKKCGQVLLYNTIRKTLFDLDKYKENKEVLEEIDAFLKLIDEELCLIDDKEQNVDEGNCEGNCDECHRCQPDPVFSNNRAPVQQVEEPPHEDFSYCILAINKVDPNKKLMIREDELKLLAVDDIKNWNFYELHPVNIKAVVTYEVERV